MVQQKLRNPSGGQGSLVNSFGLGHLSPDSIKGSNCSMDQNQIGSYEAPPLGKYYPLGVKMHGIILVTFRTPLFL